MIRVERLGAPVASPGGDPARVTVVRCAPVIGAGSPWVVLLRALGDRLPVIPCPAWMRRAAEPVAAADAVRALVWLAGADEADPAGYDLAGEDRTTYRELLALVAGAHGRRPRLVDAGIAGDVVTRVALGVAARSEPEVAALAAALPGTRGGRPRRLAAAPRRPPDHAARLGRPRGRGGRRGGAAVCAGPRRASRQFVADASALRTTAGSAVMLSANRRRYDPWRTLPPTTRSTARRPARPRRPPLTPAPRRRR